jgi:hypothetical protein
MMETNYAGAWKILAWDDLPQDAGGTPTLPSDAKSSRMTSEVARKRGGFPACNPQFREESSAGADKLLQNL